MLSFLDLFRPPPPPPRPPTAFPLPVTDFCDDDDDGGVAKIDSEPSNDDDDDDDLFGSASPAPPKGEGSAAAPLRLLELSAPLLALECAAEVAPVSTLPPAAWLPWDRFPRTVLHAAAVPLVTLPHTPPPPLLLPLAASPFAAATVAGEPGLLALPPSPAPPRTVVMNENPGDAGLPLSRQIKVAPQESPSLLLLVLVQRSCGAVAVSWPGAPAAAAAGAAAAATAVGRHVGCESMTRFLLLASTAVSASPTVMTATHASARVLGECDICPLSVPRQTARDVLSVSTP